MNRAQRKMWDDLIVEYGRAAGRVGCFGKTLHFSASREGVSVNVPQHVFGRLVKESRISTDGKVVEMITDDTVPAA